ncbi:helix-turn-helix transcriptional regulator [Acholeplasma equirhinis]|uniref:helix-turn-helix domain-containing protein n=1 Tax=Acholeplasma equirhinis TaxID=555393 RepID=UPI00197AE16C|nr:helix-turn-helix transcriptional regulator [Acholeplasma equirhinis]MBN3490524.1 helix-turn-helix transcriptional regulator [Acholeplasma equirhinis]
MLVDTSRELALFLEKMRFLRGISQEEFTEGIISNRQYQRYVRGESPMPYHLIDLFAERLNVRKEQLLLEFDNHTLKETMNIINYFQAVSNRDMDQINHYKSLIDPEYIIEPDNRKTYQLTKLNEDYILNKISQEQYKLGLLKLIEYPKILSQTAMSYFEVNVLSKLIDFVSTDEQNLIAQKIGNYLENPDLIWSGNQIVTFNVLIFRLARYYGIKEDYKSVITYSNLGIKMNTRSKSLNNLDYYFYFLALSYFRLNDQDKFKENLYKCYGALIANNNQSRMQFFTQVIEKDFKINYKEFIISYLKDKPGL